MKKVLTLATIVLCFMASGSLAAVDLELSGGMVIETVKGSGDYDDYAVYVELTDGNLIEETSTGSYLLGKVTSSARTANFANFAGFDWSSTVTSGAVTVTRYTGQNYPTGGSANAPENMTRFYRINNAGSNTTRNTTFAFVSNQHIDETNSLTAPFRIFRVFGTAVNDYGPGGSTSPIPGQSAIIPAGESFWILANPQNAIVYAKFLLQGAAYTADISDNPVANQIMHLKLRNNFWAGDLVPTTSPYKDNLSAASVHADVVDWVYVLLMNDPDIPNQIVSERSAFVDKYGNLVDVDGTTQGITMPGAAPGTYHIVIKHRTHLSVASNEAVDLSTLSASQPYDFTDQSQEDKYYENIMARGDGDVQVTLKGGAQMWALLTASSFHDGLVDNADYVDYRNNLGEPSAYGKYSGTRWHADFNMDGNISNADYIFYRANLGMGSINDDQY